MENKGMVEITIVSDKVRNNQIGTIYIRRDIWSYWILENETREKLIEEKKLNPIENESCYLLKGEETPIRMAISDVEALLHHFEPHRKPYSYEIEGETEEEREMSKERKNSIFF